MTRGSAPGKVILFGEHAVVYGRPAIAVPFDQVRATADVETLLKGRRGEIMIEAPDIGFASLLSRSPADHPLALILRLAVRELQAETHPPLHLVILSTIPVASGLGSGAAVSVAVLRAISQHLGRPFAPARLSDLAFEVERIHHGTPSGIDNTVIAYECPVYFIRGRTPRAFRIRAPLRLLVADSGEPSPTAEAVGMVRREWERHPQRYEALFDEVATVAEDARRAIEGGWPEDLGPLMDRNEAALEAMGLATPTISAMLAAARRAGALGAKISGAGLGGNIIALVQAETADAVAQAIVAAGAHQVILTEVRS
jgi:mevalonate kinase